MHLTEKNPPGLISRVSLSSLVPVSLGAQRWCHHKQIFRGDVTFIVKDFPVF